jgi:hypothetical protein
LEKRLGGLARPTFQLGRVIQKGGLSHVIPA